MAEWASNKQCAPLIQNCMKEYSAKYGGESRQTQAAKDALGRCNAIYAECANDNGVIKQSGGSYAQMYHPQNPTFIKCKKTIEDISSDAFSRCMKTGNDDTIYDGGTLPEIVVNAPARTCSKNFPARCTTQETCTANNGIWNGQACAVAPCPRGTTPDLDRPLSDGNYCKCDNDVNYAIERGTHQLCPSMCRAEDHQVYNLITRGCICAGGYRDDNGTCVASEATPPSPTAGQECLRELQEKVNSCNSAATTAVDQCNPDNKNDTIGALQNLLKGATAVIGASENCAQAAVAGSTGYYALDELRGKCDTEIGSCKTSCSDATSYINANKDRIYNACREKAFREQANAGPPLPAERFNPMWDAENRTSFEQQILQMQNNVATDNARCESGTAVTNREKMSNYMTDMDSTFKSASRCECQLNSGGANCTNQIGPKDCAADPTLPGCANVQVNCLSTSDNSPKCVCFRNPNSNECKSIRAVNNVKPNSNLSGFTGPGNSTDGFGTVDSSSGGKTDVGVNVGDLSELKSSEITAMNASGSAIAEASPFSAANSGAGSPGVNGNFGSGESNSAQGEDDTSLRSKIGGMFNTAKGAIGNLLGGKKNNETSSGFGSNRGGLDANGNPMDPTKWRPGKMVRGLASGADTELAGKFEDIWKVMNRQYKVQDQKDNFIFGEKN